MGGRFSQDFIEGVRNAGDIVQVISEYVPLKPAGRRLKGLCPFHQEKTPSFSVDPESQLFYCFGCQTGGDAFKFLMLYEKLGFGEAVEALASKFGVPLPVRSERESTTFDDLRRLNLAAEAHFRAHLADRQAGREGRAYLGRRGLDDKTIEYLGLGYAPDSWEALRNALQRQGFKTELLQRSGLVLARRSGTGYYDRFRHRVMFPIRDVQGRTLAFGGRILGDGEPKYLNSPETPTYTKGDHLYGLDLAKEAVREAGFAIVVEGYLDLAALVQAGFPNVVASLGTAFTSAQARVLARFAERVVVSYDGDTAGAAATKRSLDLLLQRGFDVRVVELPGGTDPDDYIRQNGDAAYRRLLETAPSYLEYLVRRESSSRDTSRVEGKVAAVNAVLPHLTRLNSSIERASWVGRLADALDIEDGLVLQELKAALTSAQSQIRHRPPSTRQISEAEARMVAILLRSESERLRCVEQLDCADLEGTPVHGIVKTILDLTREHKQVDYAQVRSTLTDEAERDLLTRIAFREEPEAGPDLEDCLCAFRRKRLQREEKRVVREISKIQQDESQAGADLNQRLLHLQRLARQRDALH